MGRDATNADFGERVIVSVDGGENRWVRDRTLRRADHPWGCRHRQRL